MHVKGIAECSKGSILQYFRPSLSYHLSLRSLFCPFYTGFTVYITFLHMAITKIMLPNIRLLMKFAQLTHNSTAGPTSGRLLSCSSLANMHDYLGIALHVKNYCEIMFSENPYGVHAILSAICSRPDTRRKLQRPNNRMINVKQAQLRHALMWISLYS